MRWSDQIDDRLDEERRVKEALRSLPDDMLVVAVLTLIGYEPGDIMWLFREGLAAHALREAME